jgi:DNA-binding response OmpR family regulator
MAKILIIDDDRDFQETTASILKQKGFEPSSAYTPEEGIEKVKSEKPDLIILDVLMPTDYEGFEVARKIREELKLINLPIIILSAVHQIKKVPYRFGPDENYLPVDFFIDKPAKPEMLVDKINELLNLRKQDPESRSYY